MARKKATPEVNARGAVKYQFHPATWPTRSTPTGRARNMSGATTSSATHHSSPFGFVSAAAGRSLATSSSNGSNPRVRVACDGRCECPNAHSQTSQTNRSPKTTPRGTTATAHQA